jgi:hypothetical protein
VKMQGSDAKLGPRPRARRILAQGLSDPTDPLNRLRILNFKFLNLNRKDILQQTLDPLF